MELECPPILSLTITGKALSNLNMKWRPGCGKGSSKWLQAVPSVAAGVVLLHPETSNKPPTYEPIPEPQKDNRPHLGRLMAAPSQGLRDPGSHRQSGPQRGALSKLGPSETAQGMRTQHINHRGNNVGERGRKPETHHLGVFEGLQKRFCFLP